MTPFKIIGTVLVIALVGAVIYFTFFREVDELANWQTYTNTQYEFEVKYPIGYKTFFGNENPNDEFLTIRRVENNDGNESKFVFWQLPRFLGGNPDLGLLRDPQEWLENQIRINNIHTTTTISGETVYTTKNDASPNMEYFWFAENASAYDMRGISIKKDAVGEKILSTFKFIK